MIVTPVVSMTVVCGAVVSMVAMVVIGGAKKNVEVSYTTNAL